MNLEDVALSGFLLAVAFILYQDVDYMLHESEPALVADHASTDNAATNLKLVPVSDGKY